ncbi:unnamed protein product [Symbiodinium natans]|uniref:Uncharacterized protein n=1 Tax=Symbiodinium natans TaxID=878477 RepID=A0A812U663_9DINO|nr:unnamed protein product [Symbiodinium natans]
MARSSQQDVAQLRRELAGERLVPLTQLAGDSNTDDGKERHQLVWQNFRIKDCTTANSVVLGTEHPDFIEGSAAAAANAAELFETLELVPAGAAGVPLDHLASLHGRYFGGGFEETVGKRLREFCIERFEYDERQRRVKVAHFESRAREDEVRAEFFRQLTQAAEADALKETLGGIPWSRKADAGLAAALLCEARSQRSGTESES